MHETRNKRATSEREGGTSRCQNGLKLVKALRHMPPRIAPFV